MDIQAYIASGILESYVLGVASPEEKAEVESLARQYPQVKAEIEAVRASLEAYIMQHEQMPPAALKKKIWHKIEQLDADQARPQSTLNGSVFTPGQPQKGIVKYLLAAAVTAWVLSLGINFYLYNQLNDTKQRLADATARNQTLTASLQVNQSNYALLESELQILRNPDNQPIFLKGQEPAPDAAVMVYWNKEQKEVHLAVHNLPTPAPGMQYQLWAIVKGKPVDAGMLELKGQGSQLQKMKNIEQAEVFAITLEKQGGNPTPQGKIYVAGEV